MSKINKKLFSVAMLSCFIFGFLIIPVSILPSKDLSSNLEENSNESIINKDNNMDLGDKTLNPMATNGEIVSSWWNKSYQYRRRVEIENTLLYSRDTPIDLYVSFDTGKAHQDSIRIVKYESIGGVWTAIPCQLWNETLNGDFVTSGTITFVVNDLSSGSHIYYIYYDPTVTYDPTDFSGNTFSATQATDKVTVAWDDKNGYNYNLELDKDSGVYKLEDNYNKNYHTQNSSSPGLLTLGDNLMGYWNFDDDTSAEQTENVIGGEGVGYITHGNCYFSDGKYNRGLWMDGSNDYIAINGDGDLYGGRSGDVENVNDGFTIMCWVNPSTSSSEKIIASWDRSDYWRLSLYNGKVYWSTTTSVTDDMYSTRVIPVDTWTHVAATYNYTSGIKRIYINGELDPGTPEFGPTPKKTLGYNKGLRYGFIGIGSEAGGFDGATGPNNEWYGGLDELRMYNDSLTANEIQLAMDKAVKTSIIHDNSVDEVTDGDVVAVYDLEWDAIIYSGSETMTIKDTFWFYRSLNAWKVNRTYYWNYNMMPPDNGFAAWNTFYNWDPYDGELTYQDYYYYDNNMYEGHNNVDFTVENYTILHDNDGTEHSTAVGLFITDKSKGAPQVNFTELKWRIEVDDPNNIINFIPGNETDLDNKEGGPTEYTITVEFWEFIQNEFSYQPAAAKTHFENMYQSLITPLGISYEDEENRFFNLEIHIVDHDGLIVPNMNVSLSNLTWAGAFESYVNETISDSNGNATFTQIPANNYTISLDYDQYTVHNALPLGNTTFEINETTANYANTYTQTITVNLTSLVMEFEKYINPPTVNESTPIIGAHISFWESDGAANVNEIGGIITDENGNVTLRYTNFSILGNFVNYTCTFLGSLKQINDTDMNPQWDLLTWCNNRTYKTLGVAIEDFETNMSLQDLTTDYIYGNPLDFLIHYNYTLSGVQNITGATITYKIQYYGDTLNETIFTQPALEGKYTIHLDYVAGGTALVAGRSYLLRVTAEKAGYTPMTETLNFQISNITTTLTLNSSSDTKYWRENITLSVFYNDSYNNLAIDGAYVTYYVSGIPNINGTLLANGTSGGYSMELNTTTFPGTGTYSLIITASLNNYETQTIDTYQITIDKITTTLIAEEDVIEVYWLENFTLNVRFNDTLTEQGINNANVTWFVIENPGITDTINRNAPKGDGWYSTEINSTTLNYADKFTIQIDADCENYGSNTELIYVTIKELHTLINGSTTDVTSIDVFCLEPYIVNFNYTYRVGPEGTTDYEVVRNATYATYDWENEGDPSQNGSGTLEYNGVTLLYKLDFQTENRPIGIYSINIRLAEINYVPRMSVIIFTIKNRTTQLSTDYTDIEINKTDVYLIDLLYQDTVTEPPVGIDDVNVKSYSWTRYQTSSRVNVLNSGSGVLTSSGSGAYKLDFTTTSKEEGFYVFTITLDKTNYTLQEKEIRLTINKLPANTTLMLDSVSDSVYWRELIFLSVHYNDTDIGTLISGATVTYSINGYEYINGTMDEEITAGYYSMELNSTEFPRTGEYTINVIANKQYYKNSSATFLIVIKDLYTQINGSMTVIDEIDIYRTEETYYYFNYSVRVGDEESTEYETVWDANYAMYEWECREDDSLYGTGNLEFNNATELYGLDFQTGKRPIGTYVITVRIHQDNYIIRVAIITLNVKPMEIDFTFEGVNIDPEDNLLKYNRTQGEILVISLILSEDLNGSLMNGATVTWLRGDNDLLEFTPLGNGIYAINITTDVNAFVQQQIFTGLILINSPEHKSFNITAQITVTMPMGPIPGLPTFYFLLIVGFVAVFAVGIGGYKYVQYARIPEFIKKCNRVEKEVKKNKKINVEALVTETKAEYLISKLSEDWEYFGLDFASSIGYNRKKKTPASYTDAGGTEEFSDSEEFTDSEELNNLEQVIKEKEPEEIKKPMEPEKDENIEENKEPEEQGEPKEFEKPDGGI
ncbi:MAG: LamG domain-containing protein [Promethearchaeota archaeon]